MEGRKDEARYIRNWAAVEDLGGVVSMWCRVISLRYLFTYLCLNTKSKIWEMEQGGSKFDCSCIVLFLL